MEKYVYNAETYLWMDTGLYYEPSEGRTVAEEIAKMKRDTREFIERYSLEYMLGLPKLKSFAMLFGNSKNNEMNRHRLGHREWAEGFMERKWGKHEDWGTYYVYTHFTEDSEIVGMP